MNAPNPRTPSSLDSVFVLLMAAATLAYLVRFALAPAPAELAKAVGFGFCTAALLLRRNAAAGERVGLRVGLQVAGLALVLFGLFGPGA